MTANLDRHLVPLLVLGNLLPCLHGPYHKAAYALACCQTTVDKVQQLNTRQLHRREDNDTQDCARHHKIVVVQGLHLRLGLAFGG